MAGRRKVPSSEALASFPTVSGPMEHQSGQREPYCMALVLASRSEYFWKSEQFHFILAINVLFRDPDLNLAAPGEILIYLLAAYVACREPSWRDVLIASRPTRATDMAHPFLL